MNTTFKERYGKENRWLYKAYIMEIFHLTHVHLNSRWTIALTASYFEVSPALVSENLKIARASHENEAIMRCRNRQEALSKIGRNNYAREASDLE